MGVSPNHAFYFRIFHEINQAFWSSSISGFTTKKRGFHKWGYSTPIAGWFNGESIYRWMKNGVPLWLRKPPYKYNSIHIILYIEYIYTIYIYYIYIHIHTVYTWRRFTPKMGGFWMPDPRTLDRMWVGHPAAAAGAEFFSTDHPTWAVAAIYPCWLLISSRIFFYPSYIGDYNNPIGESL